LPRTGLVETVFHGDPAAPPAEGFAPDSRYSRASLLSRLSGSSAPGRSAAATATVILSPRPALKLVRDGHGPAVSLEDGLTVGRDEGNDLPIPEASTSRKHAVIEATPVGWVVRDLGSSNGTWRNGTRITEATPIEAGDALVFGKAGFKVEAG
jgi:pSer/pThr/pTyr-binding forkhead associated (FHA) protein